MQGIDWISVAWALLALLGLLYFGFGVWEYAHGVWANRNGRQYVRIMKERRRQNPYALHVPDCEWSADENCGDSDIRDGKTDMLFGIAAMFAAFILWAPYKYFSF